MKPPFFDCVVAGLGPAGAMAAYALARAGWSVLALDKQVRPRVKICGGCLSRKVDAILPFPILPVIESTISEAEFTFKGRDGIEYVRDEPFAYIVRREKFDQFMVEKAVEAGATVRQGEGVISLSETEDGVSVETNTGCYRGKVLVGADGAHSKVARELGPDYKHSGYLALETETGACREALLENRIWIDVGWVDYGYGWIFPRFPSYSAGVASYASGGLKKALCNLFNNHRLLSGKELTTINGYPIPLCTAQNRRKKIVANRVALIGDAAGFVNPLTGEGIYYALWSGLTLATCLITHDKNVSRALNSYEHVVKTELYAQFAVAEQVARLLYGHLWTSFRLLDKHRELIGLLVEVLIGKEHFPHLLLRLKDRMGLKDKITG